MIQLFYVTIGDKFLYPICDNTIKPPLTLLIDDCYSYAEGRPYKRTVEIIPEYKDLFDLTKNRDYLITRAQKTTKRYKDSAVLITQSLLAARAEGEKRNVGRPQNFEELWNGSAVTCIELFIENLERPIRRLCKKRGLKRMLNIKSFRFYVLYYLSLIHTGWFGLQGDPRKMKDGDVGDWFHAISASAADVLVTQENKEQQGKLPYILSQKTLHGFSVMNLREFIDQV